MVYDLIKVDIDGQVESLGLFSEKTFAIAAICDVEEKPIDTYFNVVKGDIANNGSYLNDKTQNMYFVVPTEKKC